eukprot:4573334-Ditylum_brightwellii.AAC.1
MARRIEDQKKKEKARSMEAKLLMEKKTPSCNSATDLLQISSERHCRGGHCGGEWRRADEMHMLTSAN